VLRAAYGTRKTNRAQARSSQLATGPLQAASRLARKNKIQRKLQGSQSASAISCFPALFYARA